MAHVIREDEEIDEQLNRAYEALDGGSRYPGMSFEEGVMQTLEWLRNREHGEPIPDE